MTATAMASLLPGEGTGKKPPQPVAPGARTLWIARVRVAALERLTTGRTCTTDDLHPVGEPPHPKAWGTVFADRVLAGVAEYQGDVRTRRPQAHGRKISVWGVRPGWEAEAKQRLAIARVHLDHLETLAGNGDQLPLPTLPAGDTTPNIITNQTTIF